MLHYVSAMVAESPEAMMGLLRCYEPIALRGLLVFIPHINTFDAELHGQ